jgi:phosphoribosylglycinamide formyltransferase 2
MSSSGKGQSVLRELDDLDTAWAYAQAGGRAGAGRVIVEGFLEFDYEITLLTVRHAGGTAFCAPIGHRQEDGDYRESWQPQPMAESVLHRCEEIAAQVTAALGGRGLFGAEFFIRGEEVYFSEVSPRPHDTGMVTLISQDLSEFALHVRAFLGLPIPAIRLRRPSASAVILPEGNSRDMRYRGLESALVEPDTDLRLFGKPEISGRRRLGVALASADDCDAARRRARDCAAAVQVEMPEA